MKTWKESITIDVSLETIWELLDGSEENIKKLIPEVKSHKVIKETSNTVGSRYLQTYEERGRLMEYEVEVLNYREDKFFTVGFTVANAFYVTARYDVKQVRDKLLVTYTVTNKPLKFRYKLLAILMRLAGSKSVKKHLQCVKEEAEKLEATKAS